VTGRVKREYAPMTLAQLAGHIAAEPRDQDRWRLVWEFIEEYRWEPADVQAGLLVAEPAFTGDDRWDALLAALAEHYLAKHNQAAPAWSTSRVLALPWFPADLPSLRAEAFVQAPAAFRKHGVYIAARELDLV
jgi:hypothetical protein